MESRTIEQFQGKTILITGATGFLAKILVEKILRVQPNVKKLYLLIRASDNNSARQRFTNEGKNGYNIPQLSGGGQGACNFRYDIAMNINVVGAKNVLKFAKSCKKVKMLLHVSTAYVCGKTTGILSEKSFVMGETLNKSSYLDMDKERSVIASKFKELRDQNATPKELTIAMKELGLQRARLHGWQNTYAFTKAMGEMVLGHLKENLQIVIIRPAVITSTYKEPFPGWIEGVKTVDSFILAYGKGVLKFYYGDPNSKFDAIPGDMVVNTILAAVIAHENQYSQEVVIYHSSSSLNNPLKNSDLMLYAFHYFTKNPWTNKDGKTIKVKAPMRPFSSMASYRKHISTHYLPLLKMLKFVNQVSCHRFEKTYILMKKKIYKAIRLTELYEPYVFFYGSFDEVNTEKLRLAMKEINMDEMLNFDPRCIKWEDYFMNAQIPGAVKYLF
ncbi:hypothetical protein KY289_028355 [Solanum tuberosum]|nr:hypothetical protein KY289_028355 [Solanum tuberosum]